MSHAPLSTTQKRIFEERRTPRVVQLWQALARLQTIVSFMNSGAHPDDETSAMLAALGLRDGIDLSYVCSTRGEGGQNDIGTEAGTALGVLRTAEMERACDVLDMRMYWLSETPDDPIVDFGFSKSGQETLEHWGRCRTLARFVEVVRIERPDILCPTFLDIPGQHGHHRAMTEAAHLIMDLAADPTFEGSALPPWQVSKLYLPAWSGAGQAYDDDLPPPPTTLTIQADGVDPITGFSYERIGQQSRAYHRTQAMGRWVPAGEERNWPLHLAQSYVAGPDAQLTSGLPVTLADIGLPEAQKHCDAARAAFPDFDAVLRHASAALAALDPAGIGQTGVACEHAHRLTRKRRQLAHVIRLAAGAEIHVALGSALLRPGDRTTCAIELRPGTSETTAPEVRVEIQPPKGWHISQHEGQTQIQLSQAETSDPLPPIYDPNQPDAPAIALHLTAHGVTSTTYHPFETPPLVLPEYTVQMTPHRQVVNLATQRRRCQLEVSDITPSAANLDIHLPQGWHSSREDSDGQVISLDLPDQVTPGLYTLSIELDGHPAQMAQVITHDHTAPRALATPAIAEIRALNIALPKVRVGYIGGGHDRIGYWLRQLGFEVIDLSDKDLTSDTALAQCDSIVIGIFALKFRTALTAQMQRLHDWVQQGGTLLTLYHRPWDNWDSQRTAPAPLTIGQPSLRWRVTDQNAEVRPLGAHPLLSTPNPITAETWAGWHKERGLYFASEWDPAYCPLIEMADPGEAPHQGALLCGDFGAGRHIHCALILHVQMEALVPGAFALMANFLAKRT